MQRTRTWLKANKLYLLFRNLISRVGSNLESALDWRDFRNPISFHRLHGANLDRFHNSRSQTKVFVWGGYLDFSYPHVRRCSTYNKRIGRMAPRFWTENKHQALPATRLIEKVRNELKSWEVKLCTAGTMLYTSEKTLFEVCKSEPENKIHRTPPTVKIVL